MEDPALPVLAQGAEPVSPGRRNILVVAPSWVGDAVMAVPAAASSNQLSEAVECFSR